MGDRQAEILRLVHKYPEGVRAGQVAEAMLRKPAHTPPAGKIRKAGRGLYTPVESVGNWGTGRPGFHTSNTFNTTSRDRTVCGEPMALIEEGQTTHPDYDAA
jgi:hypothetical protein